MNDSLRTSVFVRYPPETIGCACIFLSARQLGVCIAKVVFHSQIFATCMKHIFNNVVISVKQL